MKNEIGKFEIIFSNYCIFDEKSNLVESIVKFFIVKTNYIVKGWNQNFIVDSNKYYTSITSKKRKRRRK